MRRLLALAAMVLPLCLLAPQASATVYPADPALTGNRISVFPATVTVPASEPSYVRHGWSFPLLQPYGGDQPFSSWTPTQQRAFFDDRVWRFELWVSQEGGTLHRVALNTIEQLNTDPVLSIQKFNYIQFPANAFAPGTYTFVGRWYGDPSILGGPALSLERTTTVVFT